MTDIVNVLVSRCAWEGGAREGSCPKCSTGSVHHEPQKNPGLFQDFQGHFSQFSRTKNHKLTADFHINNMFRTYIGVYSVARKIYLIILSGNLAVCIDKSNHL